MDFDEVADELYGVPPPEFTAARNAAADQARLGGDPELAARLRRLRRPTLAAWLANLLVREYPEETRALLELGEGLRTAREQLDGGQLRELTARRRAVVAALSRQARQAANQAGVPVSEGPQRELEDTLLAVLSDEQAAAAFATGRLSTAQGLHPEAAPAALRSAPAAPAARGAEKKTKAKAPAARRAAPAASAEDAVERRAAAERERLRRRVEEARRRTAEAERAAAAAEAEASTARRELDRATAQRERLRRKVEELSERLARARDEERAAATAERAARGRVESTDRAARTARGRARDAAAHLEQLDRRAA